MKLLKRTSEETKPTPEPTDDHEDENETERLANIGNLVNEISLEIRGIKKGICDLNQRINTMNQSIDQRFAEIEEKIKNSVVVYDLENAEK